MRTQNEVIKDFEKLGWKITQYDDDFIILCYGAVGRIVILKYAKNFHINGVCNMAEHLLLTELFTICGWL